MGALVSLQRSDWDAIGITTGLKFEGRDNRIRGWQRGEGSGNRRANRQSGAALRASGARTVVGSGALHQSGGAWSSDGVHGTGLLEAGRRHCLNQPQGSFRWAWPLWSYFCQY